MLKLRQLRRGMRHACLLYEKYMRHNNHSYWINEGTVSLPAEFHDRSANIFVYGELDSSSLNFNIARDNFQGNEILCDYVTRQIGILKEKISGYKLSGRTPAQLGSSDAAIPGEQIDSSYKSSGRTVYQRQAAFPLPDMRVLIFSATGTDAFDDRTDALWNTWLASFTPRAAADTAPQ